MLTLVFTRLTLAYVVRARRWAFGRGRRRGRTVLVAVAATALLRTLVTLVPSLGATPSWQAENRAEGPTPVGPSALPRCGLRHRSWEGRWKR
ncbi:hypothetical protein [Streptosporangium minutum]|uniref:hypothetical protein n=1 Tax=Streptosporangium minutum TaxID=569862 RepID=UPI001A99DA7E|nr:hypothetical protein [Streptosporangium minutum]